MNQVFLDNYRIVSYICKTKLFICQPRSASSLRTKLIQGYNIQTMVAANSPTPE